MDFRRFRVPLKYHDWSPSVNFDNCACLGTLHQDEHLVDPTQAIILLELSNDSRAADVVIFLHIQALVEQTCLMGADTDIPRKELERDAVAVDTLVPYSTFHVQGAHVIQEARCYTFRGEDNP